MLVAHSWYNVSGIIDLISGDRALTNQARFYYNYEFLPPQPPLVADWRHNIGGNIIL